MGGMTFGEILTGSTFVTLLFVGAYVFMCWGQYKMHQKMGYEKAWHAFVPFLQLHLLYKFSWNTKMFWVYLLLAISGEIVWELFPLGLLNLVGSLLVIAGGVIDLMKDYRLAKSFGYGKLFTAGLFFFEPIFMLILGYSKAEYKGPQA